MLEPFAAIGLEGIRGDKPGGTCKRNRMPAVRELDPGVDREAILPYRLQLKLRFTSMTGI